MLTYSLYYCFKSICSVIYVFFITFICTGFDMENDENEATKIWLSYSGVQKDPSDLKNDLLSENRFDRGSESKLKESLNRIEEGSKIKNHELMWLKKKENGRAVFGFLLFILNGEYIFRNKGITPYRALKINSSVHNTKDRIDVILYFYNNLPTITDHQFTRSVYRTMVFIWSKYINSVKKIRWIENKNDEELDWMIQYLLKKSEFQNSVLSWYYPLDKNEKIRTIIAAIDNLKIQGSDFTSDDVKYKNILLHDMRMAYEQRKRRIKLASSGKRTAINAEVSADVKNKLIEMSKANKNQINKFLEKMILDAYQRYKK